MAICRKNLFILSTFFMLFLSPFLIFSSGKNETEEDPVAAFFEKADTTFAYDVALQLTDPSLFNSSLGGRQAGSEAEHRTADFLVSMMNEIGLKNVRKEPFTVDTWQFNDSTLTVLNPTGETKEIKPYSYSSGSSTPPEGISAELVFVNEGTMQDYEGIDVKGKIVLIDIDMYNNYWIEYPTLEAELHGAVAIINSCTGGYAQLNEDSMDSMDMLGPITIPCVNISRRDAGYLKNMLEAGKVEVNLMVDNIIHEGGTSYNIVGEIPGKTDEMIIIGDHYDTHFWGFQDNSCGVAMVLTIAKGMIDSGYIPEKTFLFVLHGSEEWGAIGTRYDWSNGAWHMVNTMNSAWSGKALAFLNFEHPAHGILDDSYYVNSAPELYTLIDRFNAESAPDLSWKYPDGYSNNHYHISTWTDSYAYNQAGIPATCNCRTTKTKKRADDFFSLYYHSQFDDPDTWEEEVFRTNLLYYGTLVFELDRAPVLELDFSVQADRLSESIDEEVFNAAGVDPGLIEERISEFKDEGSRVFSQIADLNDLYKTLVAQNAPSRLLAEIKTAGYAANRELLKAHRAIQDELYRLNWSDASIFEHEHAQNNLSMLGQSVERLQNGEVDYVVDNLLWNIELHWYSYYFSKEVIQYHIDQVFAPENRDNLFWGTGRIVGVMDLWDSVQSLVAKYGQPGADFFVEIADFKNHISQQKIMLSEAVSSECADLSMITGILGGIDLTEMIEKARKAVK